MAAFATTSAAISAASAARPSASSATTGISSIHGTGAQNLPSARRQKWGRSSGTALGPYVASRARASADVRPVGSPAGSPAGSVAVVAAFTALVGHTSGAQGHCGCARTRLRRPLAAKRPDEGPPVRSGRKGSGRPQDRDSLSSGHPAPAVGANGRRRTVPGRGALDVLGSRVCTLESGSGHGGGSRVYRRILVAVDGSRPSDLALTHAAGLAREQDALLRLIHVIEDPYWYLRFAAAASLDAAALERAWREAGTGILAAAARQANDLAAAPELALLEPAGESVAAAVVAEAERWSADLIVMGTHGNRGVERLLLGSVAEGVARTAPCPLLLLRANGQAA